MTVHKHKNATAERFIEETLKIIVEKGGSTDINLREVAKRVGCAHTNAYNYFNGFEGLKWAAFERSLNQYADSIIDGLDSDLNAHEYFSRLFGNYIGFAISNPGLYRFIASDPIELKDLPEHLLNIVITMKSYVFDVIYTLSSSQLSSDESNRITEILLAYADGETLNLINQRHFPEDDIASRILENIELLFERLTAKNCDGINLKSTAFLKKKFDFPVLEIKGVNNE